MEVIKARPSIAKAVQKHKSVMQKNNSLANVQREHVLMAERMEEINRAENKESIEI